MTLRVAQLAEMSAGDLVAMLVESLVVHMVVCLAQMKADHSVEMMVAQLASMLAVH